jgi:hypothetical protein
MHGIASVSGVTLDAATTETMIQLAAAANHQVKISMWSVSFNGTSNTNEPVLVEVLRQTTAGTASSLTLVKKNDSEADSFDVTAQQTFTAEPSAGNVLEQHYVHPQTGMTIHYPLGGELKIGAGDRLGIRATAPNAVSAACDIHFEE